ncbi:hypothetical protein C2G38_788088 [Gigaspora rosea]|uniref:Uncharacterized protein n=1 Tax=Gigaspora rosea TaxID=44941 RepID=A0A397VS21_9GLOM|nr:hypothetical protein C2G38_788088 [Gigaspora rosea]
MDLLSIFLDLVRLTIDVGIILYSEHFQFLVQPLLLLLHAITLSYVISRNANIDCIRVKKQDCFVQFSSKSFSKTLCIVSHSICLCKLDYFFNLLGRTERDKFYKAYAKFCSKLYVAIILLMVFTFSLLRLFIEQNLIYTTNRFLLLYASIRTNLFK